jgi:hypothetical protein
MTKKQLTREQYHKGLIGKVPKKWHKEMLEEFDKDMLEEQLMKMPDLSHDIEADQEEQEDKYKTCPDCCYDVQDSEGDIMEHECLIHKRMNDINTFQAHENEVYLRGTDEYGKDFQICFDAYNFLEWIDTEHLKYIKKQLIKYIKTK